MPKKRAHYILNQNQRNESDLRDAASILLFTIFFAYILNLLQKSPIVKLTLHHTVF